MILLKLHRSKGVCFSVELIFVFQSTEIASFISNRFQAFDHKLKAFPSKTFLSLLSYFIILKQAEKVPVIGDFWWS